MHFNSNRNSDAGIVVEGLNKVSINGKHIKRIKEVGYKEAANYVDLHGKLLICIMEGEYE